MTVWQLPTLLSVSDLGQVLTPVTQFSKGLSQDDDANDGRPEIMQAE